MTFLMSGTVVAAIKWDGAREAPAGCLISGIITAIGIQTAAGISGGCLNPAVAILGPFYQTILTSHRLPNFDLSQIERTNYHSAYIIGTFLGGFVAGLFYRSIIPIARDLRNQAEADAKAKILIKKIK